MKIANKVPHVRDWNPQTIAMFLTAFIAFSLVGLNYYSISTLSSRDWCGQIMGAEKYVGSDKVFSGDNVRLVIERCSSALEIQLYSVAWVAKALAIALGLSLSAVFLVKFAGANAEVTYGPEGFKGKFTKSAPDAAQDVADAVNDAAALKVDEIGAATDVR